MIEFFCTRCGSRLGVPDELSGQPVRCPYCSSTVRSPDLASPELPVASLLQPPAGEEHEATATPASDPSMDVLIPLAGLASELPAVALSYIPAWPERQQNLGLLDAMAERLRHIEPEDEPNPDAMGDCPYCGSTIASFLRKCPFCRHALWGI